MQLDIRNERPGAKASSIGCHLCSGWQRALAVTPREPSDRPRCLLLLRAFTSCSAAIAMYTAVLLVPSSSLRYGKWYPPEMKDAERSKFGYEAWQQMQKFCTVHRHRFGGSSRQHLARGCRWLQMLEAPPAEDVLKREQALPSEPQPAAPSTSVIM